MYDRVVRSDSQPRARLEPLADLFCLTAVAHVVESRAGVRLAPSSCRPHRRSLLPEKPTHDDRRTTP